MMMGSMKSHWILVALLMLVKKTRSFTLKSNLPAFWS
uniref:Uncharacterized protein n=1 Tax=Romanomermis culicivorax TaxID=13658 RepID=A0A915J4A8_ROMCU